MRQTTMQRTTLILLLALGCGEKAAEQAASATSSSALTSSTALPSARPAASTSASASAAGSASAEALPLGPGGRASCEVEYDPQVLPDLNAKESTLAEQREAMVGRMRVMLGLDPKTAARILELLSSSKMSGQGNPETTTHPISRAECVEKRRNLPDERERVCGAAFMVPIYDPATERKDQAKVCIDRYEFPGLPCEYPATWITANNASALCKSLGKRLCDAHEWEGACAGSLRPIEEEYDFKLPRESMSGVHNSKRKIGWAYGAKKDHKKCGTDSTKSKECSASGWKCGSNTYPAGSFPECKSSFGVYDQHGNAAEHMLLPLKPEDLGSKGGRGVAEMKGSWFIFQKHEAHKDDCRWRAPSWHDEEGLNHANYHLSFRCCKDIGSAAP